LMVLTESEISVADGKQKSVDNLPRKSSFKGKEMGGNNHLNTMVQYEKKSFQRTGGQRGGGTGPVLKFTVGAELEGSGKKT